MVHKLFEHFLDSEETYRACERYWEQLVREVSHSVSGEQWPRWIPLHYADGTPFELDGNPICDGRSQKLDRAFRVMQHSALGNEVEIAAWLKHYEEQYTDLPREELVINLSLSEESAQLARELLAKWMEPATTVEAMQAFIRNHLPRED